MLAASDWSMISRAFYSGVGMVILDRNRIHRRRVVEVQRDDSRQIPLHRLWHEPPRAASRYLPIRSPTFHHGISRKWRRERSMLAAAGESGYNPGAGSDRWSSPPPATDPASWPKSRDTATTATGSFALGRRTSSLSAPPPSVPTALGPRRHPPKRKLDR